VLSQLFLYFHRFYHLDPRSMKALIFLLWLANLVSTVLLPLDASFAFDHRI